VDTQQSSELYRLDLKALVSGGNRDVAGASADPLSTVAESDAFWTTSMPGTPVQTFEAALRPHERLRRSMPLSPTAAIVTLCSRIRETPAGYGVY
jgi:hypothetical protein